MTTQQYIIWIALPIAGYLLGSIPFAWLIARAHGIDLRQAGSKNIGASNLARVLGTKYFFFAFILDAGKGFLPVLGAALLAQHGYFVELGPDLQPVSSPSLFQSSNLHAVFALKHVMFPSWAPLLTAIACVVGHLFPIWLKFRGGKGVATGFGVVLGFWPLFTIAGILSMIVFVTTLMLYRYISVSSISGAASFTLFVALLGNWKNDYLPTYTPWNELLPLLLAAGALSLLIILKHRGNIARLIAGTEVTVGHRESTAKSPPPNHPPAHPPTDTPNTQ